MDPATSDRLVNGPRSSGGVPIGTQFDVGDLSIGPLYFCQQTITTVNGSNAHKMTAGGTYNISVTNSNKFSRYYFLFAYVPVNNATSSNNDANFTLTLNDGSGNTISFSQNASVFNWANLLNAPNVMGYANITTSANHNYRLNAFPVFPTGSSVLKSVSFQPSTKMTGSLYLLGITGYAVSSISGTIYNDISVDATANGTGTNGAAGNIALVGPDNKVVAVTTVGANGAYTFTDAGYTVGNTSNNYKLILCASAPAVGSTMTNSNLNTGWSDFKGANADGTSTSTGALISITRGYTDMTGQNISVHKLPTANDRSVTISSTQATPTLGSVFPMNIVQASNTYTLGDGKLLDFYGATNGAKSNPGTPDIVNGTTSNASFVITSLSDAGSAVLYGGTSSSNAVSLDTKYPSTGTYSNTSLYYKFSTTNTTSNKTYTFGYRFVDAQGYGNITPATYTINLAFALPVTYAKELDATMSGKVVNLTWTTATEVNNSRFEVERSTDGNNWSKIASIPSYFLGGNGTGHSYSYPDETPFGGTNYYRLKQVDRDGATKISGVAQVSVPLSLETIKIFPNPVIGTLNIRGLPSNASYVAVYSIDGKLLLQKSVTSSNTTVDLYNVPSGMYTLKISDKNGQKIKSSLFSKK